MAKMTVLLPWQAIFGEALARLAREAEELGVDVSSECLAKLVVLAMERKGFGLPERFRGYWEWCDEELLAEEGREGTEADDEGSDEKNGTLKMGSLGRGGDGLGLEQR